MKANRGFTLIELAVVLAVIAVLAAILTPLVTSYIDQARETRAGADVRAIAQAAQLYKRDTGKFPIYADDTDADADTESVSELVGDGSEPAFTGLNWEFDSNGDLDTFLNTNKLSLPTDNPRQDGSPTAVPIWTRSTRIRGAITT